MSSRGHASTSLFTPRARRWELIDIAERSTEGSQTPIARGAGILTLGMGTSYGLSFLRNLILARLLTKADFGVAALFANTLAIFEVASRMSFGQQIVQSPEGASKTFRDNAHALQLVAAFLGAGLVLIVGVIVAIFVRQDVGWALSVLSLGLLARGLENLDVFREQRDLRQGEFLAIERSRGRALRDRQVSAGVQ